MGSGKIVSQVGQKHGWTTTRPAQLQHLLVSRREDFLRFARAVGEKIAAPARHIW
jgi:hypothetical protein